MVNKKIAFLVGAGCEGAGQLELPSGKTFKKDTLLAEGVRNLIYQINKENGPIIKNGPIIRSDKLKWSLLIIDDKSLLFRLP